MSQGYASAGVLDPEEWQDWTPTYANFTLGNGTMIARYILAEAGRLIVARLDLTFGSTTSIDAQNPTFSTPVIASSAYTFPRNHVGSAYINDAGSDAFPGQVRLESASTFSVSVFRADSTYASNDSLAAAVPMTWAENDGLSFTVDYEPA